MDGNAADSNDRPDAGLLPDNEISLMEATTSVPAPTTLPSAESLFGLSESTIIPSTVPQPQTSLGGERPSLKESTESVAQGDLLVQEAAEKLTSSMPVQRPAEGLSSLVSYSSSSAEASGSEDNTRDGQEDNSLPGLPETQKEEPEEEPKVETEAVPVKQPQPQEEKVPEEPIEEPMEVTAPEIQETVPAVSDVQPVTEAEVRQEETLETLEIPEEMQDPEALLEKVFGLVEKEEVALPDDLVQQEAMEIEESTPVVPKMVQEQSEAPTTVPEVREPSPDIQEPTPDLPETTLDMHETVPDLEEPAPEPEEPTTEAEQPTPEPEEPTPEPEEPAAEILQDREPEEVPDDPSSDNDEKTDLIEDQEEVPSVESVHKPDPLPDSVKSPEEDGEVCTLKLSSDDSTGPNEVEYKRNAEEKKELLESVESSRSGPDLSETVKEDEVPEFLEDTLGMKLKRVLDEEKESADEPVNKRACLEDVPVSSTSFEGKILERQNTIPFEPEGEMMSDQLMGGLSSETSKVESIQKSDDESRDGMSLGSESKDLEGDKLEDMKKKMKEEEEEMATPSSKRRRKKRSYERPRGEGGKFRKEKPDSSVMDEDTRMDSSLPQDEDSQGSMSKREVRRFRCEVIVPESTEAFTADKVVEYVWPLEGLGEHYFIQEQISQYLGIMSFKRKYPDLRRRPIDMQERDYLKEKGLVSEMACDLGLTAVRSEDVLDVMFNDFPSKFEELQRLLRERKEIEMKERGKIIYSMANIDKSKMQEYGRKAAEDAARWNAAFNKEKRDERRYSFDLQTFTLQKPSGKGKKLPPEMTKMGYYTVAVLPGQFTDHYREYSSAALSSLPLNSVVAPPVTRDTLGSDGAGSDSEEDVSVPTQDEADSLDNKDEKGEDLPRCKVCAGNKNRNKGGKPEPLIICGSCRSASHPTCIDLTLAMVPKIESYNWQCMDCKNCVLCSDPDDEEKMIFCDMCDRGYHIYCVGLRRVPNGRWHCKECAICSSCGSKTPAGNEHVKNAEWQHEFKKDKDNKQLKYATTLCVPCDKYWKRRQFCYVCLKVYRSIPEDGMVRCSNCPKYIHKEGCSTMYENERFCNNCFKMRNTTALNHSRIIAAAKKKMASGY